MQVRAWQQGTRSLALREGDKSEKSEGRYGEQSNGGGDGGGTGSRGTQQLVPPEEHGTMLAELQVAQSQ